MGDCVDVPPLHPMHTEQYKALLAALEKECQEEEEEEAMRAAHGGGAAKA